MNHTLENAIDLTKAMTFKDIRNNIEFTDYITHDDEPTGHRTLKLQSENSESSMITDFFRVTYGNCIEVDLIAKADAIGNDIATLRLHYWRNGKRDYYRPQDYDITATDQYKDHKFRFAVPIGVEQVEVTLY